MAAAQDDMSGLLPGDIERLLDADPLPPIVVDPARRYLLLVHQRQLLPLERLAEPAVELAGKRINPRTASKHAPLEYYGLTLVDVRSGRKQPIPLPRDSVVGYPIWAPDGSRFAFTLTRSASTELWIGEPAEARARKLLAPLNASQGSPCTWAPDSRRLLCRSVDKAASAEAVSLAIESASSLDGLAQGVLDRPVILDDELTSALLESQLEMIDSLSGQHRTIGKPAAFETVRVSPAGAHVLVSRILKPYPRVSGVDSVNRVIEVWDRFGNIVKRLPRGVRAVDWHAAEPATLTWVEDQEGTDHVMLSRAPFQAAPTQGFSLPHRFSGLRWLGDTSEALVGDYNPAERRTSVWHVDLERPGTEPRLVVNHRSTSPLLPIRQRNRHGMDAVLVHEDHIYLRGETTTGADRRAFLDRVSLDDGVRERIWQGSVEGHETLVDILAADGSLVLTRQESMIDPPNYFVSASDGAGAWTITHSEHPAPMLADTRHLRLAYERNDGLGLGASLYLPPGYDGESELPMIVWAYPHQIAAGSESSRIVSGERFLASERAFRLFFLLRGYAVLDDVSMPIVGNNTANDTFIEQIVANADAAISAAAATGFVDSSRVGVAGHSYGAFMVANLLAHSRLFVAGAALSGAYNRTLTPFGFQTERRTLWEAPDTYLAMSPLLYSHRIEAPLLLVHGLLDDNAGTSPYQSTQFYQAIRGNGGDVDLLLLPWEGHSYRARESVLKTASQILRWFDRHLTAPAVADFNDPENETGAFLRPSQ